MVTVKASGQMTVPGMGLGMARQRVVVVCTASRHVTVRKRLVMGPRQCDGLPKDDGSGYAWATGLRQADGLQKGDRSWSP